MDLQQSDKTNKIHENVVENDGTLFEKNFKSNQIESN